MRLRNSTDFADYLLRRMVSWCAGQIGLPRACVRLARFTNYRRCYRGCARLRLSSITVRVGGAEHFPREDRRGVVLPDRLSAVVLVTAHALAHILAWRSGAHRDLTEDRDLEPHCDRQGHRALHAFLEDRGRLEAIWSTPPRTRSRAPRLSAVDRRAQAVTDIAAKLISSHP